MNICLVVQHGMPEHVDIRGGGCSHFLKKEGKVGGREGRDRRKSRSRRGCVNGYQFIKLMSELMNE